MVGLDEDAVVGRRLPPAGAGGALMTGNRASYALRGIDRDTFVAPAQGWRERAACRDASTAAFFPDRDGASNRTPALKLCNRCPVRKPCLEFALLVEADATQQMRFGIWGGTWPAERKRIANARRADVA